MPQDPANHREVAAERALVGVPGDGRLTLAASAVVQAESIVAGATTSPARYEPRPEVTEPLPALGTWYGNARLSPSGRSCALISCFGEDLKVEFWSLTEPVRVAAWRVKGLGRELEPGPFASPDTTKWRIFSSLCFVGEDHVAVATVQGRLSIHRVSDGSEVMSADFGSHIEPLASCSTRLAVSTWPTSSTHGSFESLGIKVFDIEDVLSRRRFEAVAHFRYDRLRRGHAELVISPDGRTLLASWYNPFDTPTTFGVTFLDVDRDEISEIYASETLRESRGSPRISIAADGRGVIVMGDELLVIDPQGRITSSWRPFEHLPDASFRELRLDRDHALAWLKCRDGRIYSVELEVGSEAKITSDVLRVTRLIDVIEGGRAICQRRCGQSYDMVALDRDGMSASVSQRTPHHLRPHAVAATPEGAVVVADRAGSVRIFDGYFRLRHVENLGYGPVQDVLAHPDRERAAILASDAISWIDVATNERWVHRRINGQLAYDLSDYTRLRFDSRQILTFNKGPSNAEFVSEDGSENSSISALAHALSFDAWIAGDPKGDRRSWAFIKTVSLPIPIVGLTSFDDRLLLLLGDGRLLAAHPFDYQTEEGPEGERLLLEGPHIRDLGLDVIDPRGMARFGDDGLVLWDEGTLYRLQLHPSGPARVLASAPARGVAYVEHDVAGGRLLVNHQSHISIRSMELEEIATLYPLRHRGHLLHVPIPDDLRRGIYRDHPGFIFSDGDELDLIRVTDASGREVEDRDAKRAFLDERRFRDEGMVRMALTDFAGFRGFVANLAGAAGALPAELPLLPGRGRGSE